MLERELFCHGVFAMNPPPRRRSGRPSERAKLLLLLMLVGVFFAALAYFGALHRLQDFLKEAVIWIGKLGYWAPVLFIALYVAACVALVPAAVLTLAGGAAFGLFWGVVYVLAGAILGSTAAFLVGRHFARDWVAARLGSNPTFAAVDRATERDGWKIVFLTRLAPVFPFFLMNYAYGVTRVSLRQYFFATATGIVPGTTLFVYVGALANSSDGEATSSRWVWRAFILATAMVATLFLGRIARRTLNERVSSVGDETGAEM